MRTRILKLRRYLVSDDAGGRKEFFASEGGDRRRPRKIFHSADMPEFEGDLASFLVEWVRLKGWAIVRRVQDDGSAYTD